MIRPAEKSLPAVLAVLCLLFITGCGETPSTPTPPPATQEATVAAGEPGAEDLAPTFSTVGPFGAAPQAIHVDLPPGTSLQASWGEPLPDGNVLVFEPEVAGSLRMQDFGTMAFEPRSGFAPGQRYKVELQAVVTQQGVLTPPAEGAWSFEFGTPDFELVSFAPVDLDPKKNQAQLALVFSGPVAPQEVARRARFSSLETRSGERRAISDANLRQGADSNTVDVLLPRRYTQNGRQIELVLQEGIASSVHPDHRSAYAEAVIDFASVSILRVLHVLRSEADSGFYLRVVCDDQAGGRRGGFWDEDLANYFQISQRCLPDEDSAREKIRFEPEMDFSVAAGRGGFRIFPAGGSRFERGNYRLHIDRGLRSVDGSSLTADYGASFEVPARRPSLSFASKGRYLPRRAAQRLALRHVNSDRAVLSIRQVPPENLVFWMSDDDSEAANERNSNLIYRSNLALRGQPDQETTSHIDIGSMVPESARGLLEVRVSQGAAVATARVLATDTHLIAKRLADGRVNVWALDMHTLEPQSGVAVDLIRRSGLPLASCRTGGKGACEIPQPRVDLDSSPPFALVARNGSDLTYLRFSDLKTEVQEERISGDPYNDAASGRAYRAAVYSERGVYRPGETAHLAAVVRDGEYLGPPGLPVEARVVDPRGKTLRSHRLTTNEAGVVTMDVNFPAFATTGRYRVVLEAGERPVGQHTFQVEEFVPERMKVEARAASEGFLLADTKAIEIGARYLFGGVPADHRVELSCDLEPSTFRPEENAEYHYGVWQPQDIPTRPIQLGTADGTLNADGLTRLTCPSSAAAFAGPARLVARAAVFEAGSGRTSVGTANVPVHPEPFYVGLKTGASRVEAGNDLVIDGVTVDHGGERLQNVASVEVELIRLEVEWGWYYDDAGYWNSRHQIRPVTEDRREVEVRDGRFQVTFRPGSDGPGFLVRARVPGSNARTDLELDGMGQWYYRQPGESDPKTPAPGRATWIALNTPEKGEVGKKIDVSFTAPFNGRVLFTAETDGILESAWKEAEAGREVSWRYEPETLVPNVYMTAFLVKDPYPEGVPRGQENVQAFMPERAFGVRSVTIEPVELVHPLKLETPEEVRSNSQLTVDLDMGRVEKGTYATVAAVDEGILSLTNFQSPDPFPAIFNRRALGVETYETVGWTLLVPPSLSTAAGDMGAELGRVQPVKPVALWSGLLEVPENGKLSVDFDVPQYRGALRVMAVTAGNEKMGRADATVLVRDPIIVQSTLPRFLTLDDDIRVPVFVSNVSGRDRDVDVEIEVETLPLPGFQTAGLAGDAPVEILGNKTTSLALADGAADTAVFRLRTVQPVGAARVKVTVRSGDVVVEEEAEVPLLPSGPKERQVQKVELAAGETDLRPLLAGWVPLSEKSTFRVTTQEYADVFGHMSHLLRYPHGCLEQTTSTARPLLVLKDMLPLVAPDLAAATPVEAMVQSGIDRLLSMQTPSGGFAFWMGGTEPTDWGTAYATHFLIDAQKEGYTVPQESLDEALEWMERQITHQFERLSEDDLPVWRRRAEPYFHYVLALADRGRKARVEELIKKFEGQDGAMVKEHLYMLQAALYLAGDQRYEAALKNPDLSLVTDLRTNDWSFFSDRRRRGFMLSAFVDLFGRDKAGEPLANLVAESLRGRRASRYTTQELVWGLTGLGKYSEAGTADFATPILRANNRVVESEEVESGAAGERLWSLARASEYNDLNLEVPSKGEGALFLIVTSEGVRTESNNRNGGEGLILTRRFRDRDGNPVALSGGEHALGDVVYVELELSNRSSEKISNLALVDRIPSGWEIENPRLGRSSRPNWVPADQVWAADHLEVRDDRIEVFGSLARGGNATIVYAVRAVTAGRFTIPTAEAEAMYDPRIWARAASQQLFVNGPWLGDRKQQDPAP